MREAALFLQLHNTNAVYPSVQKNVSQNVKQSRIQHFRCTTGDQSPGRTQSTARPETLPVAGTEDDFQEAKTSEQSNIDRISWKRPVESAISVSFPTEVVRTCTGVGISPQA